MFSAYEVDTVRWRLVAEIAAPRRDYRIDFALRRGKKMIFIECDGAAFHSLPKDVARDKRKDARAGAAGIQVLRFTGKELNANSDFCAWLAHFAVTGCA